MRCSVSDIRPSEPDPRLVPKPQIGLDLVAGGMLVLPGVAIQNSWLIAITIVLSQDRDCARTFEYPLRWSSDLACVLFNMSFQRG